MGPSLQSLPRRLPMPPPPPLSLLSPSSSVTIMRGGGKQRSLAGSSGTSARVVATARHRRPPPPLRPRGICRICPAQQSLRTGCTSAACCHRCRRRRRPGKNATTWDKLPSFARVHSYLRKRRGNLHRGREQDVQLGEVQRRCLPIPFWQQRPARLHRPRNEQSHRGHIQ